MLMPCRQLFFSYFDVNEAFTINNIDTVRHELFVVLEHCKGFPFKSDGKRVK